MNLICPICCRSQVVQDCTHEGVTREEFQNLKRAIGDLKVYIDLKGNQDQLAQMACEEAEQSIISFLNPEENE